ncbi:hypothetical protein [Actinomadura macrotermitis]|uniref:Uncharacterized protein n=1 Tax=Actinomadura macrotermitis TaxID=2585200 RepID=A0A7K0C190_9ACTN|nr:hypothetical protein [Actinomadura macrotermitis]MQY07233.1 hypothetical protein [Actinomadura macrotermitis]
MTHTNTPKLRPTTPTTKRRSTTRRLRRTIGFALARGAAHATGTGLIGLLFWWITHR